MWVMAKLVSSLIAFSNLVGRPSWPWLVFEGRLSMILIIVFLVICWKDKSVALGLFRNCSNVTLLLPIVSAAVFPIFAKKALYLLAIITLSLIRLPLALILSGKLVLIFRLINSLIMAQVCFMSFLQLLKRVWKWLILASLMLFFRILLYVRRLVLVMWWDSVLGLVFLSSLYNLSLYLIELTRAVVIQADLVVLVFIIFNCLCWQVFLYCISNGLLKHVIVSIRVSLKG